MPPPLQAGQQRCGDQCCQEPGAGAPACEDSLGAGRQILRRLWCAIATAGSAECASTTAGGARLGSGLRRLRGGRITTARGAAAGLWNARSRGRIPCCAERNSAVPGRRRRRWRRHQLLSRSAPFPAAGNADAVVPARHRGEVAGDEDRTAGRVAAQEADDAETSRRGIAVHPLKPARAEVQLVQRCGFTIQMVQVRYPALHPACSGYS